MKKSLKDADLKRAIARIGRVEESVERVTNQELMRTSSDIVGLAKSLCPVGKTGDLQASLRWEWGPEEYTTVIGTNIEYAPQVEFGTRIRHAQPFLFPAFKYHEPVFRQTLEQRLLGEMRKLRSVA